MRVCPLIGKEAHKSSFSGRPAQRVLLRYIYAWEKSGEPRDFLERIDWNSACSIRMANPLRLFSNTLEQLSMFSCKTEIERDAINDISWSMQGKYMAGLGSPVCRNDEEKRRLNVFCMRSKLHYGWWLWSICYLRKIFPCRSTLEFLYFKTTIKSFCTNSQLQLQSIGF